jgi:RNA recognition motif-containing protein
MKKGEREMEKKKDTLRYKASKKRCNLFIKNFPNTWTKEDIENLFTQHGEIENIKFDKGLKGNFAFVCYKQPDFAANAKLNLNNAMFEGKSLVINHYEIKE